MAFAKPAKTRGIVASEMEGKDFAPVFIDLKRILERYQDRLLVKIDTPDYYYLETKSANYKGKPVFCGAVKKRQELCELPSYARLCVS